MGTEPWEQLEKLDAKRFGGRQQIGSGITWSAPGDVRTEKFLIDSKFTEKKSYSVSKKTWDKLYEEALFEYRIPILSIRIQDLDLCLVDTQDLLNLIKKED